jgi:SNF2 family DNA or RNA helicase
MVPEVPSTLQAELRDYQVEGFVWMVRLAHLGVGACLADDMGLGKTLQALAVILSMAKEGPTLVIAPTSVCMNWEQEINRFAPTLKIKSLSGTDRKAVVKSLKKFDVLISSYTLLQQEIELIEEAPWQTIVLDEAQAIKNAGTKRSRAAMRLRGRFKLITTGTPIENHLGELWNLFRFINPGLLGSYKQFNARFGIPIEKHHDREASRKLKKIIRPFMLRRIKSQVLDELPPRTEVTLRVEMKPEELRFYEALRQQALENIESSAEKSGRHLQILAEIMKLRRACCNPRLIMPDTKISSTKLEVFAQVVEELIGSRHKALVFSQFTGHLALLREYLDKQGVVYKYLDGTTPTRERQRQVETFQEGEGDLFLISLKAGGLGLNLTAADYVIHMDPWWNPAVEDQAADRAHRIGQKRPVTVYRLITTNTIEEKIVRLHQEKRDLANSLLEGSDVSARISADELLELIRES